MIGMQKCFEWGKASEHATMNNWRGGLFLVVVGKSKNGIACIFLLFWQLLLFLLL